jgi:hypothetical protein
MIPTARIFLPPRSRSDASLLRGPPNRSVHHLCGIGDEGMVQVLTELEADDLLRYRVIDELRRLPA